MPQNAASIATTTFAPIERQRQSNGIRWLRWLILDGNDIRGTGLKALAAQPKLIDLSLGCPTLGDLLASNLAELKQLKRLSLAGSGLGDAGIKHLASLTNLEFLDLRRTKATAAGIAELQLALPTCRIASDF